VSAAASAAVSAGLPESLHPALELRHAVVAWLSWFDVGVLAYFLAINTS
jgi:hypothetical protein